MWVFLPISEQGYNIGFEYKGRTLVTTLVDNIKLFLSTSGWLKQNLWVYLAL